MNLLLFALRVCASAAEWIATPTGTDASLRGIAAVSDRVVWVSGSKGTVLKTVDGGGHWEKMKGLPESLDFRGIQTFDGQTVLAMAAGPGEKSAIYRTGDGGATWKLVYQNKIPEAFFDGITFYDALRGMVIGDPVDGKFFLLTTSDGGQNWSRLDGPQARDGEGAFAASNTSLVVTRAGLAWFGTGGVLGGRVFTSYDWGRTWTAVSTTIPHETAAAGAFSLAFVDAKHGYAVGGDYKNPKAAEAVLAETNDGGVTWHTLAGPKGYRSAIATDGHHIIVTGPEGTEVKMPKSPEWQSIAGEGFHALSLPPKSSHVWASGSNGRVAKLRLR